MIDNFKRTEKIARLICNKSVEYSKDYRLLQTPQTIQVASHWTEAVHEVAHWIACDPEYRNLDNLGLPKYHDDTNQRMLREEVVAQVITKLLSDKYFDGVTRQEKSYIEYINQNSIDTCNRFKWDRKKVLKKSYKLFSQYDRLLID